MASYVPIHVTIFSIAKAMTTVGYPSLLVRLTVTRSGKEEVRYFPMPEVKTTSMDRDMEID